MIDLREATRSRAESSRDLGLERPQVVWFTLGGICTLGLMFAAGYVMGRRAARIEPVAAAADPLAQIESDREMHEKLTFYERLRDPSPPAPAAPPRPAPVPQPPAAEEEVADSSHADVPASTAATKPAGAAKPASKESSRPQDPDLRRALNSGPAHAGEYTVQVSAFQSRPEAEAFASGLERKGYKPFVVTTSITGKGTWYRVRMGRFSDEGAAKQAKTLLAAADIAAWVLRTE